MQTDKNISAQQAFVRWFQGEATQEQPKEQPDNIVPPLGNPDPIPTSTPLSMQPDDVRERKSQRAFKEWLDHLPF